MTTTNNPSPVDDIASALEATLPLGAIIVKEDGTYYANTAQGWQSLARYPSAPAEGVQIVASTDPLTPDEHELLDALADVWRRFQSITDGGVSRSDLSEVSTHIHALQHMVMSSAAGRIYPARYRTFGGVR